LDDVQFVLNRILVGHPKSAKVDGRCGCKRGIAVASFRVSMIARRSESIADTELAFQRHGGISRRVRHGSEIKMRISFRHIVVINDKFVLWTQTRCPGFDLHWAR
jgi:hypothetical protein